MGGQSCQGCLSERMQNGRLRARLRETENKLRELQSHHALSLKGLIRHCEDGSCQMHGSEWRQVKQNVIARALEKLPDEFIEERALARGIFDQRYRVLDEDGEKAAKAQERVRLAAGRPA